MLALHRTPLIGDCKQAIFSTEFSFSAKLRIPEKGLIKACQEPHSLISLRAFETKPAWGHINIPLPAERLQFGFNLLRLTEVTVLRSEAGGMMSSGTPPSCTYVSELYELWGLAQTASMSLTGRLSSRQSTMKLYWRMQRWPFKNTHCWGPRAAQGHEGERINKETPEIKND